MGYAERNTWAGLVTSVISITVYVAIIVPQLGEPVGEIEWLWPLLWTIGGGIIVSIVASILWGIVAGRGEPSVEDVRDRDIARLGDRVGQAFLVIAMLGALVLCAVTAPWFWIAQTLYAGFALSAVIGSITRVIVYRAGMP